MNSFNGELFGASRLYGHLALVDNDVSLQTSKSPH